MTKEKPLTVGMMAPEFRLESGGPAWGLPDDPHDGGGTNPLGSWTDEAPARHEGARADEGRTGEGRAKGRNEASAGEALHVGEGKGHEVDIARENPAFVTLTQQRAFGHVVLYFMRAFH